jgi:hypothetical protein
MWTNAPRDKGEDAADLWPYLVSDTIPRCFTMWTPCFAQRRVSRCRVPTISGSLCWMLDGCELPWGKDWARSAACHARGEGGYGKQPNVFIDIEERECIGSRLNSMARSMT